MAGKKGSKNFGSPNSLSYWMIKKGLPEDQAIVEQQKYVKEMRERKIQEFGSEEAYHNHRSKNCSLKKENVLKRFDGDEKEYLKWKQEVGRKGDKLYSVEYWTKKGFSEEEAKLKIIETGKKNSPRTVEFWKNQGYSEDEAIRKVHDIQDNTSLSSYRNKYGEEEGLLKYRERVSQLKEATLFYDSDFQKEMSSRTRFSKTLKYWLDKGFSKEEVEEQRLLARKVSSPNFPEYYEKLGFSIEESLQLSRDFQVKASASRKFLPTSRIEQEVFDWVSDNIDSTNRKEKIYDSKQRRYFFPDVSTDSFILEVYGDYWHANPDMYDPEEVLNKGKTAKQIRSDDKKRITRLYSLTGRPVFVVWEKDLLEKGIEVAIKEAIGDMYENCKKN